MNNNRFIESAMAYLEDEKLIIWRPSQPVDPGVVLDYFARLKQCLWGHQANRFCDFSNVGKFELDFAGLVEIRDYRMAYLSDHINIKLAMYSHKPLGFAMSRMYQTLLQGDYIDIIVTRNLAEAAAFLKIPLPLLSDAT